MSLLAVVLIDTFAPRNTSDPAQAHALGERYALGHPAEYVTVATGTVHLRKVSSRRTVCGTLIPLDGQKLPRYSTTGTLTCNRCGQVVEKALDAAQNAKRAK